MPIFSNPLPPYQGSYKVGTLQLEIPVPRQTFGTALLKGTNTHALVLETVLATAYYPASPLSKGTGHRQSWAERPLSRLADGYARFSGKSRWLFRPAFWIFVSGTQLPAFIAPALADKQTTTDEPTIAEGGKAEDGKAEDGAWPVIIFSHGLGGTMTTYSQYCGELASHGNVVFAIEHRDGSGPASLIHLDGGETRVVEYLRPEDLVYAPSDPVLTQIEWRKEELVMRLAEVKATLELARRLNEGEGQIIAKENRRSRGVEDEGGLLQAWGGRLNLDRGLTLAGHSFGGATTIQALRAGGDFPFARGVCLDPWVQAIPPAEDPSSSDSPQKAGLDIDVPLLVINSEAFTVWQSHFSSVREIVRRVQADAWFLTLVGSVHVSFSDLPIISTLLGKQAGARVVATDGMHSFVATTLEFLSGRGKEGQILGRKVVPGDEEPTRDGEGEGNHMEPVGELRLHFTPRES